MYCGSWHRRLVSRIRSCAVKRGGGREKNKTQRTAKRYDDDGHGKDAGLILLLLATLIMRRERFPHKRTEIE